MIGRTLIDNIIEATRKVPKKIRTSKQIIKHFIRIHNLKTRDWKVLQIPESNPNLSVSLISQNSYKKKERKEERKSTGDFHDRHLIKIPEICPSKEKAKP